MQMLIAITQYECHKHKANITFILSRNYVFLDETRTCNIYITLFFSVHDKNNLDINVLQIVADHSDNYLQKIKPLVRKSISK